MPQEIRWRVLIADPRVPIFLAAGRDGSELTGKATAPEIVECLKAHLEPESFDPQQTQEWLETQDPADAGDSATLRLTEGLELEIVVRAA